MIYLRLFAAFLKIGAVSFGGGYGMISLIRETTLSNGWLTEEELLDFIAVSESTPGPIAVNIATFVGSSQAGILGAFVATLGIILPAFIIILLIAAILKNIVRYGGVKAFLGGVRPAVTALVLATFATMFLSSVFGIKTFESAFAFDWKGLVIFAALAAVAVTYRLIRKKSFSPILLILLSAALGIPLYAF